jgi:hypothetical protein
VEINAGYNQEELRARPIAHDQGEQPKTFPIPEACPTPVYPPAFYQHEEKEK